MENLKNTHNGFLQVKRDSRVKRVKRSGRAKLGSNINNLGGDGFLQLSELLSTDGGKCFSYSQKETISKKKMETLLLLKKCNEVHGNFTDNHVKECAYASICVKHSEHCV